MKIHILVVFIAFIKTVFSVDHQVLKGDNYKEIFNSTHYFGEGYFLKEIQTPNFLNRKPVFSNQIFQHSCSGCEVRDTTIKSGFLFKTGTLENLRFLEIIDLETLTIVKNYKESGEFGYSIEVDDEAIFVATNKRIVKIGIINNSGSTSFGSLSTIYEDDSIVGLDLSENHVFVINGTGIVGLSKTGNVLGFKESYCKSVSPDHTSYSHIFIEGDYAYCTNKHTYCTGMEIFVVSNPSNIQRDYFHSFSTSVIDFVVENGRAYNTLNKNNGFTIIDVLVNNPTPIVQRKHDNDKISTYGIGLSNKIMFSTWGNNMKAYDVTDVENQGNQLTHVWENAFSGLPYVDIVRINQNYIFIGCGDNFIGYKLEYELYGTSETPGKYEIILTGCDINNKDNCIDETIELLVQCPGLDCQGNSHPKTDCSDCECDVGYSGDDCQSTYFCGAYSSVDTNVCSGNGDCILEGDSGVCKCDNEFIGNECEIVNTGNNTNVDPDDDDPDDSEINTMTVIVIILGSIIAILILVGIVVLPIIIFLLIKMQKYSKIKNIDLVVAEQELETKETAKIDVNEQIFQVKIKEIKIKKKIGQGGSSAVVYLAEYHNTEAAFKVFHTNMFGTENYFSEFEKEVSILAGVKYPFILGYLGATVDPPRVGILMEYCPNGDLKAYLKQSKHKNYDLKKKLQWAKEICMSMQYLHSKSIIHRDLKPENVLLTANEETRLMDFGLSKLVQNSDKTQTSRVGTSYYIAPEVVVSGKYGAKCDVFSFSILLWELILQTFEPYGKTRNVEVLVSRDPNMRPSLRYNIFKEKKWLKEVLVQCWNQDPESRLSFSELVTIFKNN